MGMSMMKFSPIPASMSKIFQSFICGKKQYENMEFSKITSHLIPAKKKTIKIYGIFIIFYSYRISAEKQ